MSMQLELSQSYICVTSTQSKEQNYQDPGIPPCSPPIALSRATTYLDFLQKDEFCLFGNSVDMELHSV